MTQNRKSSAWEDEAAEMARFECPVDLSQRALEDLSQDMTDRIRQLRAELERCPDCPLVEDCRTLLELNQAVQVAIDEVTEAWSLATLIAPPEVDL